MLKPEAQRALKRAAVVLGVLLILVLGPFGYFVGHRLVTYLPQTSRTTDRGSVQLVHVSLQPPSALGQAPKSPSREQTVLMSADVPIAPGVSPAPSGAVPQPQPEENPPSSVPAAKPQPPAVPPAIVAPPGARNHEDSADQGGSGGGPGGEDEAGEDRHDQDRGDSGHDHDKDQHKERAGEGGEKHVQGD